jgi:predicted small metal-binding protein
MNKINFYTYPDIPTRKFYTLLNATSSHIKEILNTVDVDCDFAIVNNNESNEWLNNIKKHNTMLFDCNKTTINQIKHNVKTDSR